MMEMEALEQLRRQAFLDGEPAKPSRRSVRWLPLLVVAPWIVAVLLWIL